MTPNKQLGFSVGSTPRIKQKRSELATESHVQVGVKRTITESSTTQAEELFTLILRSSKVGRKSSAA
jgi:hypothetical protein